MNLSPLFLSLEIAVIATAVAFVLGLFAAYLVVRIGKFQGFVDALFTLPLVLPPTVVGFFLLVLFGKNSIIGQIAAKLGGKIIFTPGAAVIAAVIVAFPLMYRTARGAFEQMDEDLIHAARTLGKSEGWIFFRVTLPNSWPGILAGTVLAFARALGEFGATMMVAGNIPGKTQTMALAVYTAMQAGNLELAWKWVGVILLMSLLMLVILNSLLAGGGKKEGTSWL